MSRLADLEKRLSRLRSRELNSLSEDAVGLIRDDVEEIQTALTEGDFGSPGKQAKLVTEATNLLRDLSEVGASPKSPDEKKEDKKDLQRSTSVRAESADDVVSLVVESIDNPPTDLQEATKLARKTYREAVKADGPLKAHELEGVAKAAKALLEKSENLDRKGPLIKARITGPSLTESGDTVIEARSERELSQKIAEVLGDTKPTVVEIDRSEAVYQECASRFSSLLEAQTLKADKAIRDFATNQAEISEVSAKLAGAKQLIQGYSSARVELKERVADVVSDLDSATRLLEAVGSEFLTERLRGAVVGIAATHPGLKGLSEALSKVTSVGEAISVANSLLEKAQPAKIDREPVSPDQASKVTEAIQKDAKERKKISESKSNTNSEVQRNVALTQRVIADFPNPRGN